MEPTFTKTASETVTAELSAAVAALPPAHCLNPEERVPVESRETAFVQLQN